MRISQVTSNEGEQRILERHSYRKKHVQFSSTKNLQNSILSTFFNVFQPTKFRSISSFLDVKSNVFPNVTFYVLLRNFGHIQRYIYQVFRSNKRQSIRQSIFESINVIIVLNVSIFVINQRYNLRYLSLREFPSEIYYFIIY